MKVAAANLAEILWPPEAGPHLSRRRNTLTILVGFGKRVGGKTGVLRSDDRACFGTPRGSYLVDGAHGQVRDLRLSNLNRISTQKLKGRAPVLRSRSSTSKSSQEFGGITPPAPLAP